MLRFAWGKCFRSLLVSLCLDVWWLCFFSSCRIVELGSPHRFVDIIIYILRIFMLCRPLHSYRNTAAINSLKIRGGGGEVERYLLIVLRSMVSSTTIPMLGSIPGSDDHSVFLRRIWFHPSMGMTSMLGSTVRLRRFFLFCIRRFSTVRPFLNVHGSRFLRSRPQLAPAEG